MSVNSNNTRASQSQLKTRVSMVDFVSNYPLKTYAKGEMILLKGEALSVIYLVESGAVKAFDINYDGNEQIVSIYVATDLFPVNYIFLTIKKSQFFYTALTACNVRLVPRGDFMNYLESDIVYMRNLCVKLTKYLVSTTARITALGQPRAIKKVALRLLHMPDQLGINKRPHKPNLKLVITQQEIADSIGLSRETTAIELNKLRLKKIITYTRCNYIIHMEKLRKYLNDQEK